MPNELILLVDDEPHIIELASLYLEQDGFRVISAGDGLTAPGRPSHPLRHSSTLRPGLQLTRVPGRDVLSRPGRAHRSPSTAASSMPWDSIPISLAGFRLATMMTWRPTRSSGR